jgi:hypothetical protein
MTSLAVDMVKKRITLSLADQTQMSGYIFLSRFSKIGTGRESVLEALVTNKRFLPFETSDGEVNFINQRHIVWLASLIEPDDPPYMVDPLKQNVTVYLFDGKRLRGDVNVAMPEEKNRLSDALNALNGFLVLRDEKREVLINLEFIIRIS